MSVAMRIAPGGDEPKRAPTSAVQVLVGDLDRLSGEVGENGQRIAELSGIHSQQQVV